MSSASRATYKGSLKSRGTLLLLRGFRRLLAASLDFLRLFHLGPFLKTMIGIVLVGHFVSFIYSLLRRQDVIIIGDGQWMDSSNAI